MFTNKSRYIGLDVGAYKMAKIPFMFDNIRVIDESDEKIFEDTYVTGVLPNDRVVKFKKDALSFDA